MLRAGNPGSAAPGAPQPRHGPYPSLTPAMGGKTRSRFLTDEQAAIAQQPVAAGRHFRAQMDGYWKACEQWADTQLQLSPAASWGAQKGGSRRNSQATSSRKSKRS